MQIIGEWIMRSLFWNDQWVNQITLFQPEKVVSTVMDTIAVGMSIGAWGGRMYSIFLFLCGDWMVECVVAVTIYMLLTYCYADYSRFFVSDSWDFPDPSYFIFNL